MKKLVLLLVITCMVSVSMTYASGIKKQEKKGIKIENALIKASTGICISGGKTINFPKPKIQNTPEQCANDAWLAVWSLVNEGESYDYAYARGQQLYDMCVSVEQREN